MAEDPKIAKLRLENGRLKLEKENATLRAEIDALAAPWWRSARTVAALTAFVAAIVPVTTAVHGYYQKERELALEEAKQAEQVRTSYLEKVKDGNAMFRTLRFIEATSPDKAMRSWAAAEVKNLEDELTKWSEDATKQSKIVEGLERAQAARAAKDSAGAASSDPEAARQREALDRARKRLEQINNRYGDRIRSCNCNAGDPLCSCL